MIIADNNRVVVNIRTFTRSKHREINPRNNEAIFVGNTFLIIKN